VSREPGYPGVGEHLASRRDVLTFVGASLVTGVLSSCLTTLGGVPASPEYRTFRLPGSGELETTLASGEACRFYVNGVYYGDWHLDYIFEEDRCIAVMGEQTASDLATTAGFQAAEQAIFDALSPLMNELDELVLTVLSP
jgi:hypothetical protein